MLDRIREAKERVQKLYKNLRFDSWSNPFTGLGTERDKMYYNTFSANTRLDDELAETLYAEDDIAARVCDTMPEYAFRKGVKVQISPDDDAETDDLEATKAETEDLEKAVMDEFERLDVVTKFTDAAVWANVFGGCALLIGGADGARGYGLLEPLNENAIKSITHLNVIDKRYMIPISWYTDPEEPMFGEPRTYLITPFAYPRGPTDTLRNSPGVIELHESRLLMFGGVRTSIYRRQQFDGWKDGLLQRMHTVLKQFGVSWDSLAHIISDANMGVFKMAGLIDAIAANETDVIQQRLQLLDISRSNIRSVVLDAGDNGNPGEEFLRQNFSWSGIREPFDLLMYRLSAAARVPVTVLMGRSPAGMNATGESDERNFYDQVEAYRTQGDILPNLNKLVRLLFLAKSGPTNGKEPGNWYVEFPNLWSMTPKEEAEIYNLRADGDTKYITAGVLLPEEVALSRFGPEGGQDATIMIDLNSRVAGEDEPELEPVTAPPAPVPNDKVVDISDGMDEDE